MGGATGDAPLRLESETVINEQVARGVERLYPAMLLSRLAFG